MVLKVRLGGTPVATLHTNNATLRLRPLVEVLASASNSAFHSLFSLDVVSEVGWVGLTGRALMVSETSLPAPHLLCPTYTGILVILSMFQNISASGLLPRILFLWLLPRLASLLPQVSA